MGTSRELEEVERRIQAFEDEYGISTEQMIDEVTSGVRRDDFDTNQWLILATKRRRIVAYLNKAAAKAMEESDA